jgi:hypothetical protein
MMQLAIWYFGFLVVAGLLFVAAFAGCLWLMSSRPAADGYARLVGGGSGGVGVAVIALAALLVAGYQLDDVWLGDLLQNGLLAVALLGACGCGIAAYLLRGHHERR